MVYGEASPIERRLGKIESLGHFWSRLAEPALFVTVRHRVFLKFRLKLPQALNSGESKSLCFGSLWFKWKASQALQA